jgi:hypothetical protein
MGNTTVAEARPQQLSGFQEEGVVLAEGELINLQIVVENLSGLKK